MIVKLDKDEASTEGISNYIFYYSEDRFNIYPYRREKVKFLSIGHDKDLDFLDTLGLRVRWSLDILGWHKKQ